MTRTAQKQGPSKIITLAPAAVILIVYGYVFHSPQQNQLRRAKVRLGTLADGQQGTEHELAEVLVARASTRKAEREITAELDQERERQDDSIQQVTAMRHEVLSPSLPVATVKNVTRLFGQHGLHILESQPDKSSLKKARQSLETLVGLLAEDKSHQSASRHSKGIQRDVYRLKLAGRFEDLNSALEDLAQLHQNVVPLSLEMAPLELAATAKTQARIWYLTIMV